MPELRHPLPRVDRDGRLSQGGNQQWSARWDLRKCGCGVIAAADLLLYLTRHHGMDGPAEASLDPIPLADYDRLCERLQKRYLPIVPPFGITGIGLALGLNACCRRLGFPLKARWGVASKGLWDAVGTLLDRDLPVILAIGQTFPAVWSRTRLPLYRKNGDVYTPAARAKAHYVTVFAMDDVWLQVSSWGRTYYIHKDEFLAFGREQSLPVINNLLWLEKKT